MTPTCACPKRQSISKKCCTKLRPLILSMPGQFLLTCGVLNRCQACRAIKLRCVRQADGLKCARCDRLELECRFVEKKRGRKPKNHQVSSVSPNLSSTTKRKPSPVLVKAESNSPEPIATDLSQPATATTPSPCTPPLSATAPGAHKSSGAAPMNLFHPFQPPQNTLMHQPSPQIPDLDQLRASVHSASPREADDPVKAGLISSTEIPRLFEYFMSNRRSHGFKTEFSS